MHEIICQIRNKLKSDLISGSERVQRVGLAGREGRGGTPTSASTTAVVVIAALLVLELRKQIGESDLERIYDELVFV
eukprot:scaffold132710_cov15-Prasinocladus_malaysianus.AAC.1